MEVGKYLCLGKSVGKVCIKEHGMLQYFKKLVHNQNGFQCFLLNFLKLVELWHPQLGKVDRLNKVGMRKLWGVQIYSLTISKLRSKQHDIMTPLPNNLY